MRGAVWNYVGKLFENCRFTIFLNEIATPKTSEQVPKFWARNDRVPSLRDSVIASPPTKIVN